jgi:hypothetical protein
MLMSPRIERFGFQLPDLRATSLEQVPAKKQNPGRHQNCDLAEREWNVRDIGGYESEE